MSQHRDEADRPDRPDSADAGSGTGQGTGIGTGISDEELPEDLQATDDNPLAQPLEGDDVKSPEELDMRGGKVPEQRRDDESDG